MMEQIDPGAEITLVNIEAIHVEMAARVLNYCCRQMRFTEALLVAPRKPEGVYVGRVMIDPLFAQVDTDHCFLSRVLPLVRTEFILVVQNDGFIIGAQNWSREFLKYDYVAAPWKPDFPSVCRIGCGAFTLQSQRFARAQLKHRHTYPQSIEAPHRGWDFWVSHAMHPIFTQQEGIQYAPLDVACKWALEYEIPEVPYTDHGRIGFHKFTTPEREKYKERL